MVALLVIVLIILIPITGFALYLFVRIVVGSFKDRKLNPGSGDGVRGSYAPPKKTEEKSSQPKPAQNDWLHSWTHTDTEEERRAQMDRDKYGYPLDPDYRDPWGDRNDPDYRD